MIQWIAKRLPSRWQTNSRSSDHIKAGKWELLSLTPQFIEREHSGYVRAISEALANKQLWNIAVSGNYGVGKSSILREVTRQRGSEVVELSLSTLSPADASLEESASEHATTTTNRIQQEIVKQLLYQEKPRRMPGSRFHRIERFSWRREALKASLISFLLPVLSALSGWSEQLKSVFPFLDHIGLWVHLFIWLISAVFVLLSSRLFYGKIHFSRLSAGSATVTLDDKSASYFDQYLDEIVYFFEASNRRIVVFEDIDRFDNSRIFETLRTLNTLLNTSPQVNGTVQFIYAIKDSIFDQIAERTDDPAEFDTIRANRTKFFDLVIPIVPFITHQSARNLAEQLLDGIENEIDRELIDLAAQYVPDMRLLKNIRNEFIIFHDRIFSGDGDKLKLNESNLFAMMLYKSTHLTDFEAIRIGQSNIDRLYSCSRKLVQQKTATIERDIIRMRERHDLIDQVADRSAEMGRRLNDHATYILKVINTSSSIKDGRYIVKNQRWKTEDINTPQFWKSLLSSERSPELRWSSPQGDVPNLLFTLSDLERDLGVSMDAKLLDEEEMRRLNQEIYKLEEDLNFLRGADFKDLIERSDFLLETESRESPKEHESLKDSSLRLLGSELAYHLVRTGYINRNFTLYTSTFHGNRVGPAAMNFLIHHVECDNMDEYFQLEPEDVEAVVRVRGRHSLKEPALYNIDLLDDRLRTNISDADIMIAALAEFGDKQTRFIQSYMRGGTERVQFVQRFTPKCSEIFIFLVDKAEIDEVLRLELFDAGLRGLSGKRVYRSNDSVKDYVLQNYENLSSLISKLPGVTSTGRRAEAERIAEWFSRAGLKIPRLASLTDDIRQSFVEQNLYEIEYENLRLATCSDGSLALDVINSINPQVYENVLDHLNRYVEAVKGISPTIRATEQFIPTIEDVLKRDSSRLNVIVAHASSECTIQNLANVSKDAWSVLAEHGRFTATFANVRHYLAHFNTVDAGLAEILSSSESVSETEDGDNEAKRRVARAILAADDTLSSARLRVSLVESLALTDSLGLNDVKPENGELFALLINSGLISDSAQTYEHLADTDWTTREAFIRQAAQFPNYMTAEIVRDDVGKILESKLVGRSVKATIAAHASEYIIHASRSDLIQLASYAIQNDQKLEFDVVKKMVKSGVEAPLVVPLLEPSLNSLTYEQLREILESMKEPYPKLVSGDQKQPKVPNTPADQALLETLKRHNVVTSYSEIKESQIRVYKRKR